MNMFFHTIPRSFRILFYCLLLSCNKLTYANLSAGLHVPVRQIVVVRSPNADSRQAMMRKFEKKEGKWMEVGEPIEVSLGRAGLAPSSEDMAEQGQILKKEGDGKSPSGLFSFGSIFGYAPPSEVKFKMPYTQANDALECVDDSNSDYYNQLVDNEKVEKDWTSSEFMHRQDHQYRWGIVVNHNTSPTLPMGGSCIFFHVWKEPHSPTSGCTAMSEDNLLELLLWLDPDKSPILLQVVEKDYPTFKEKLGLP